MPIEVVDLFCGIGGLTKGLINSGLDVIAGFDNDSTCQYTYEHNNHVNFNLSGMSSLSTFISNAFQIKRCE